MSFWKSLFGREPTEEEIAEFLKSNKERQTEKRRKRAIGLAHYKAHKGNDGAIGELTEEALREFKEMQKKKQK